MAALIEAVAAISGRTGAFAPTGLRLTDDAARECLRRSGHEASDIDLLINAGIYHDRNLGEPAVAALIQQDIGANPGHPVAGHHGTFSFDLLNGTSGVLSAVQLVDGLMASGTVQLAMIVAGDVDPDPGHSPGFKVRPAGAAMLLRHQAGDAGFKAFKFQTFPEFEDLFQSSVSWHPASGPSLPLRPPGHNVLAVVELPGYLERSVACTASSAAAFLEENELRPADIDLLVAAHTSPGFADMLADQVGIPRTAVAHLNEAFQHTHTAQVIARLAEAQTRRRLHPKTRVLVATAGAGITVGLALYSGS